MRFLEARYVLLLFLGQRPSVQMHRVLGWEQGENILIRHWQFAMEYLACTAIQRYIISLVKPMRAKGNGPCK